MADIVIRAGSAKNVIAKQNPLVGLHILAKFFLSKSPDGQTNCISRTLGKFGIVDKSCSIEVNHQDIWVCEITKEIKSGQNNGAFVLWPKQKIDPSRIRKLIPGFYETKTEGKAVLIYPTTDASDYWMISKKTRQLFSKKFYAVVVPVEYGGTDAG